MRNSILFLFTLFLAFGCKQKQCEVSEEISNIDLKVKAQRFDKELFNANSKAEVSVLLQKNPQFTDHYLQRKNYPSDSALVTAMYRLATEPNLRQLADWIDHRPTGTSGGGAGDTVNTDKPEV